MRQGGYLGAVSWYNGHLVWSSVIETPVALISDVHANLEALDTVLEDIDSRGIERIVCLGDTIGYGPNPRECLDKIIDRCEWSLLGNHDYAALYEPTNFNAGAEAAAFWTRQELESETDQAALARRWEFLASLEIKKSLRDDIYCVHGSPRRPINEYIFSEDAQTSPNKMTQIFNLIDFACFVGHTHVQGVFTTDPDFMGSAEINYRHEFGKNTKKGKVVINVGSVGQPRDRDTRSGYAILHKNHVEFVRLHYDIEKTIDKIKQIAELNNFFGERLLEGR